jgi:2-amino-4-hydroxy-6-hydroxymethyldihydropteridine diphosphokinase
VEKNRPLLGDSIMTILTLSLGSNTEAAHNIRKAVANLRQHFGELLCSSVYESEAVGFSGNNFINLVVILETGEELAEVILTLKHLEDSQGRVRTDPKFSGRTLDIDILTFGNEQGLVAGIELPRSEITKNAYVLCPLAEVAESNIDPASGETYGALWQAYAADQKLWRIDFDWKE